MMFNRPDITMPGAVGIDDHAAIFHAHTENLAKTQRPAGRGPPAIVIKAYLRSGFIPEA
jgi:hypothetical protein